MTDEKATGTDAGRPEISRYLPASEKIPGCGVGLGAVGAAGQTAVSDGSSIKDFLDSIYLAGVDFSDNGIEEQARSIEKSYQMLKLLETSVNIMRNKHKHGEMYYWLLYYSYLSPQQYRSVDEIIEMIRPHVSDISERTFFRRRKNAVEALSSILWGYTSRDSLSLLEQFFPDK